LVNFLKIFNAIAPVVWGAQVTYGARKDYIYPFGRF